MTRALKARTASDQPEGLAYEGHQTPTPPSPEGAIRRGLVVVGDSAPHSQPVGLGYTSAALQAADKAVAMGYAGFLIGPAVTGFIADATSLRLALAIVVGTSLLIPIVGRMATRKGA